MTEQEKIVERVQKLLALAGNNPNENEAAAAMEKVQAMLAEHNLAMSDVQTVKSEIDRSDVEYWGGPWARRISSAIAKLYFCDYVYGTWAVKSYHNTHIFIGKQHNVQTAQTMARWVVEAVGHEAYRHKKTEGAAFVTAFMKGASRRICSRVFDMIEAAKADGITTEGGTNLPMVVEYDQAAAENSDWMASNMQTKTEKSRERAPRNMAGVTAGKIYGDSIQLGQSIEAA